MGSKEEDKEKGAASKDKEDRLFAPFRLTKIILGPKSTLMISRDSRANRARNTALGTTVLDVIRDRVQLLEEEIAGGLKKRFSHAA